MERMREEYGWPRESRWEWYKVVCGVPEGYGASGSRDDFSSERICSRGNRECRVQHERVPETSVPEHETIYKPLKA